MPIAPLRKLFKALFMLIAVVFLLIGTIQFIAGLNAYLDPNAPEVQPFEQILLAVGFLGVPASGLFFYKARKSLQLGMSRYGLPDSPGRSFTLTVLTITAVILTTGAFVIALTVF